MTKNYKYLVCKTLVSSGKVSTLELMRKNRKLLEVPGYFVSNILQELFEAKIIERVVEENKFFYFSNQKTEEWIKKEEQRIKHAEEKALAKANEKKVKQQTSQNNGCYIATAVYGSYDCPQVWTLRRYRDYTLTQTWHGRAFIKTYYAISPTLVKWFGHTEWFKKMWQGKLDCMVAKLQDSGVESTPYEDKEW